MYREPRIKIRIDMKYIDADRLRAEIERKIVQYSDWADEEWDDDGEYNHGAFGAFKTVMLIVDSLQQEQPSLPDNLELNMTRTNLELNEIETLTHLVHAKAVEPGNFQGLYKNILSKLNKMFDEEYADREKEEQK